MFHPATEIYTAFRNVRKTISSLNYNCVHKLQMLFNIIQLRGWKTTLNVPQLML